jgi:S1-C subfamily serine protease
MFKLNTTELELRLKIAQQAEPENEAGTVAPRPKVQDPILELIQEAIKANCTIFVKSGKKQWTGSGFHLGGGFIATAAHVVPPELQNTGAEISITFDGRSMYPAALRVSDPNVDSAIIYNPQISKTITAVKLGNSDKALIGDIISVISSPEGWHDTATVGRISNMHQSLGQADKPAWNDIIFIDADILEGSSGGMIIGTDGFVYGSVMGVTGQKAEVGIGERAICPSNKIMKLLQLAQK